MSHNPVNIQNFENTKMHVFISKHTLVVFNSLVEKTSHPLILRFGTVQFLGQLSRYLIIREPSQIKKSLHHTVAAKAQIANLELRAFLWVLSRFMLCALFNCFS